MRPLVSVILPIYNDQSRVRRCLKSLLTQSYNEIEYIIVDDGCTDDSYKIICGVFDQYPNRKKNCVLLRHATNQGSYAARLTGMNVATGDYIIQVDSDDYASPQYIEYMVDRAQSDEADIVLCGYTAIKSQREFRVILDNSQSPEELFCNIITGQVHAGLWNKLMKRSIVSSFVLRPGVVRSMYDDKVISMQAAYYAKKLSFIDTPLYSYTIRNSRSITDTTKYVLIPDNSFISFAESFYDSVPVSNDMRAALDTFAVGVCGKSLLYGSKAEREFTSKYLMKFKLGDILSHPTIPFYYKLALALERYGLSFAPSIMRMCTNLFIKR